MMDFKGNPFFLDDEGIAWIEKTLSEMTVEEKAGQLFCVLLKGEKPDEVETVYSTLSPGACMYRSLPYKQGIQTTRKLRKLSKIPLLIAANLEKGGNGIVAEGTLVGSPMEIAATDDERIASNIAEVCAREARMVGANWAFAPIIDIDTNFRNPITNTRTFGSDPERVCRMGKAYVEKLQSLGMAAAIKHFPGDGQDERDQHLVTTINDLDCEAWMESYGETYKRCIDAGALSVMVGHIMQPAWSRRINPQLNDEALLPATLSSELMQGLLRKTLGFHGLICTDATTMAGFTLAMSRRKAVPETIARGADMFLFARNLQEDYHYMLGGIRDGIITQQRLDEAVRRILATKAALGLHQGYGELCEEEAERVIGCPQHHAWAKECADKAITLVKEQPGVLPITPERYRRILFYAIEPPAGGEGNYKLKAACSAVKERLVLEGFAVDTFEPKPGGEGFTEKYEEILSRYDLILYVANLATKSNQTVVRIEWQPPMGSDCGHYIHDVPTVFVSLENPYHLLDFPRVKTYINCYSNNDHCLDQLIEKLTGRSTFQGINPVDPFCGKWDARL